MAEQVVLVTGAGRGIGRSVCCRFAKEHANIVAAARSEDEIEETRRLVDAAGGACLPVRVDVSQIDQVDDLVRTAEVEFGGVDVLVNNAGLAVLGEIEHLEVKVFDTLLKVNAGGVFYVSRAVWPSMCRRGGGVIVSLSSMAAVNPYPGLGVYGATKCFVEGLTRGLAQEGAAHDIRAYGVAPGAVETRMLRGVFPDFPADQCVSPDDVAELIWLLTQPGCRYSSGQTIRISRT